MRECGGGDVVTDSSITVVMADDNARLRGQIRDALQAGGCRICGEAAGADEAVELVARHRPDVVLLDIQMPGNGIRAAQQISRAHPETAIVMLTQSAEDEDLFDSLRAGASGYLLKAGDPRTLADALRGVLAGEAAMPPALVTRILQGFGGPARRRFMRRTPAADRLTTREWEVMQMLGQGHCTEEVARRPFVSPTTVRVHVSTVVRKPRVKDRDSALQLLRGETS